MIRGKGVQKALAALAVAAALGFGGTARAEEKVVFVDMDKVFTDFYKTKLADAQLKDQAEEYKNERTKMVDDFKKLQDEFQDVRDEAQNTALSEEARNQKRNTAEEKLVELRETEAKIRRFEESRRRQLDEQMKRVRDKLVVEIKESLAGYAKAQGYTAVVDSSGENLNGVPTVMYFDAKNDITQVVIELLNTGKK
jgi:outer membrane protein